MDGQQQPFFRQVFSGERLQGFSDAVFAIIATFMVVPLTLHISLKEVPNVSDLATYLVGSDLRFKYGIYFFAYSIVVDTWFTHVAVFSIIKQVDDVILILNLAVLVCVSFLPYTYVLLVSSLEQKVGAEFEGLSIALCSGDIAVIGIVLAIILLYAFKNKRLLHADVTNSSEIRLIQCSSAISVLLKPLLALLTLVVALGTSNNLASFILFYAISGVALVLRVFFYIYYKNVKKTKETLPRHFFKTIASKFRIEFFSDGVFSIVATLLVLNTTTQAGTTANSRHLLKFIQHPYTITSYLISFSLVGFLWLIHHQMFQYIEELTPVLVIINFGILFMVGLIPFASKVDSKYSMHVSEYPHAKRTAVQLMCFLAFFSGLMESLFWIVAIFNKRRCMSNGKKQSHFEGLQFSKAMVIPIVSLFVYFGCLMDGFVAYHVDVIIFLSIPIIYILLDGSLTVYSRLKKKVVAKSTAKKFPNEKETESLELETMRTDFSEHYYHSDPTLPT